MAGLVVRYVRVAGGAGFGSDGFRGIGERSQRRGRRRGGFGRGGAPGEKRERGAPEAPAHPLRSRTETQAVRPPGGSIMSIVTLILMAGASMMVQERCEVREVRELSAPATDLLRVESGAGPVEIVGDPAASEIAVTATLCASDQERFDALDDALDDALEGGSLTTRYPESGWSRSGGRLRPDRARGAGARGDGNRS